MDAGYEPRELVFGNITTSIGAVGGITGTLKTLIRGEIKEFSDVFNETRHHALGRLASHAPPGQAQMPLLVYALMFCSSPAFTRCTWWGRRQRIPALPPT